jgi:hypothetical protein
MSKFTFPHISLPHFDIPGLDKLPKMELPKISIPQFHSIDLTSLDLRRINPQAVLESVLGFQKMQVRRRELLDSLKNRNNTAQ